MAVVHLLLREKGPPKPLATRGPNGPVIPGGPSR